VPKAVEVYSVSLEECGGIDLVLLYALVRSTIRIRIIIIHSSLQYTNLNLKKNAIPVRGSGGLYGCEMSRIPHCLDNRLTVKCEILATCSSTYSQFVPHRKHTPSP
jgi:hypothetical protein